MNLLTDILPTSFEIDGAVYPIKWDFRAVLNIMEVFEDDELTLNEKYAVVMQLLFTEKIPKNLEKALELTVRFINCGDEADEDDEQAVTTSVGRLYSFSKDANYIFTAINQTHGIDVQKAQDLHWWKFVFLFSDISEDCFFSKLIYLRKQLKTGKLTKDERQWYNSIKKIVDLENNEVEQDENMMEFMEALNT